MTSDDPRVQQLLDELFESRSTPEQVCASCPELLDVVRARWRQIRCLSADLDAMFPSRHQHLPGEAELPQIPGYQVESLLGRGGMGIVFRARHLRLNRPVALKMILSGAYAAPEELARFMREAEAIAALQHPNIVQIYDIGEVDGRPYFTMELVGGGSLAQKLGSVPQPAQYATSVTESLARAIHTAHLAGIIHRDVKPSNVLLALDGTPKISDFGLARYVEGQADVTLGPAKVGSPSYMAPEQVAGEPGTVGPPADIYGLGAALYELLTGRPPFRADTSTETERQVLAQEPAPPSRLNAKVPHDLETICLKCLQKEPARRYESAAALADDLVRYREGRPIRARRMGWGARLWRWCRRKPASAALAAMGICLFASAIAGGLWLERQRTAHRQEAIRQDAELRNEVGAAIAQAASLRKGFHFNEAREILEQGRQRLGRDGPDQLRRQVDQAQADLDLAKRLDAAQFQAASIVDGKFDASAAEPLYASAFTDAGLGREKDDSKAVAARIRKSAVRAEIVAALDDWASITPDPARRAWLLAIARGADPDAVRDQLRQPKLWQDAAELTRVAQEMNISDWSPRLAAALGRVARGNGGDAVALLIAAQTRFPQDFWINYELGVALRLSRPDEALGYFRAALALRPDASAAYNCVGYELKQMGRLDEALDYFRQAIRIDPNYAIAQMNMGDTLCYKGRLDDAIDYLKKALSIDANLAVAHADLGYALWNRDADESISQFQQALTIDPHSASAHNNLGFALYHKGRVDEAIEHLEQAVRSDASLPLAYQNLGFVRYAAACTAVLTAANKGGEKAPLDESRRARLREQALERLRANVELASQLDGEGKVTYWSLSTWQFDTALRSVRDPGELTKLPVAEREQWQRLWSDVAAVLTADPLEQGRALAARKSWDRAADNYSRFLARGQTDDGHFWFEYAALLLLSGDHSSYVRACAHMRQSCGKADGPRAYHVARAYTLDPDSVADWSVPGRLADSELHASAEQFWSLTERGALAYRAGRFQDAVPFFEQSLQSNPKPGAAVLNWLWLALADQHLKNAGDAQRWLEKAQKWLDQFRDGLPANAEAEYGLHLHNWLEANVLRREAEALIAPRQVVLPAQ